MRGNAICVSGAIAERRKCWFSIGFTRENRKPSEIRPRYHHASRARRDSHGGPLETQGISMIPQVPDQGSGGAQRMPSGFLSVSLARKACFCKGLARFLGNRQDHFFWQAPFAQKACFITVLARFARALFFGKIVGSSAKSHAKLHLYIK